MVVMLINFTDLKLKSLKTSPDGKAIVYRDKNTPRLNLIVNPSSKKVFKFKYVIHKDGEKKQRTLTIGEYPSVSIAEARAIVSKAKVDIQRGIDPQSPKDELKIKKENSITIEQGIKKYIDIHGKNLKTRTLENYKAVFDRFSDYFGSNKEIKDLDPKKISTFLEDIANNPKNKDKPFAHASNNAYRVLKTFFAWLYDNHIIEELIMGRLKKLYPNVKKTRERFLIEKEIKELYESLSHDIWDTMVKVLLLTGQRRGEIAEMKWSEIDFNNNVFNLVFNLPAERSKNKRAHQVPLSKQVADILRDLPRFNGGDYVFSTTNGEKPLIGLQKHLYKMRKRVAFEDWSYHTFRHTFVTHCSKIGISKEVISATVNHSTKQTVTDFYNKNDYAEEKAKCMQEYADWVEAVVASTTGEIGKLW